MGLDGSDYYIPIALKLEIGEVNVTVSREAIDYSEKTIKLLKNKLLLAKAEIISLINKQYNNVNNLEDYFKVKNDAGELLMPNGNVISIKNIIKVKDIAFDNFKYNFMKMPNDRELFNLFFSSKNFGKKEKKQNYYDDNKDNTRLGYKRLIENNKDLFYYEDKYERKVVKGAWLKSKHTRYYLINKVDLLQEKRFNILDIFNVHDTIILKDAVTNLPVLDINGNVQPTLFMKSILELQDEYFDIIKRECTDYNGIVVPDDFIESRKANNRKLSEDFRNSTIPIKIYGINQYSSDRENNIRIKLDSLIKLNIPIYYGIKEDEHNIRINYKKYALLFGSGNLVSYNGYDSKFELNNKKGILFIRISQNNVRYMKFCKKAYHIDKFDSKMLHRKYDNVIEYFQLKNIIDKYASINELYKSKEFREISPVWANKIDEVKKIINKYNGTIKGSDWSYNVDKLSKFYNLDLLNITNTKEQMKIMSIISEVKQMDEMNNDVLKHIYLPRYFDKNDEVFWNILRKILIY